MNILSQISQVKLTKFWQKTITVFMIVKLITTQQVLAQFTDAFSDGDFLSNPTWTGIDSKFTILSNQLKLQAPAVNGNAYLSTASKAINNAEWEFFVRLNFNPSATNYACVYLVSDQPDVFAQPNGYYVMVGDTPDEISLYRQTGSLKTKIIDGADGRTNLAEVIVKIKVTRNAAGQWELFSDIGATGNYVSEGTVVDNTHISSAWFGVYCEYSATRSDKFFFDDIKVSGDPYVDTAAPEWQQIFVISSQKLELTFNEALDVTTAEDVSNYVTTNGQKPQLAQLNADQKKVVLTFNESFTNGAEALLTISGIKDLAGNTLTSDQKTFVFFVPVTSLYKDVIITEIFADPSPSIGLPPAEFLEIYNRSLNPIDVGGWIISDGSSNGIVSKIILRPGEYLILTASASEFSSFAKVTGVQNFPTLNNSGDAIVLKDPSGVMIDSVRYTDMWYQDEDKKLGGWTLELIDPANTCAEKTNWIASENQQGGTPGKQNSVYANKPDLTGPKLLSVVPTDKTTLKLLFDEKLDKNIPDADNFLIDPDLAITAATFSSPSLQEITLSLSASMMTDRAYKITVSNVYDCAGNKIQAVFSSMEFGIPDIAETGDFVINEVLFNPRPTGVDFVEIYNQSSKFFNLKDWTIANIAEGVISNPKVITGNDLLLGPGSFLVLTTKSATLKGEYIAGREENFFEMPALPSLHDDEGNIAIIDNRGTVIDHFLYSDKMHSVFLKDDEGVSLERITAHHLTNEARNWRSASSASAFATPGYVNSNTRSESQVEDDAVKVEPEIFQPQSAQGFAQISFSFKTGGFVANVNVVDAQGRKIKVLANNEILGAHGFLRWDGDADNGTLVRTGYYIVLFEIFDERGTVKTFKKRVAIAGRF